MHWRGIEERVNSECMIDVLKRAAEKGNGINFIYSEDNMERVSYETLYERCMTLAYYLKERGFNKNINVIMDCERVESWVYVFWACQIIGCIPVLVPHKKGKIPDGLVDKLKNCRIVRDYNIDNPVFSEISICLSEYDFQKVEIVSALEPDAVSMQETCCMLLSSGTTSSYKIVPLTGTNLISNIREQQVMAKLDEKSRILSWMPLHHSGGFVIHHMGAIISGCEYYLIPTDIYSVNPLIWLSSISKYKITFTGTISSAMKNVINRFRKSNQGGYDFSSLLCVSVGAENVSTQLCYEFENVFETYGLKKGVVTPTYGMTETSCLVGWGLHTDEYECYMSQNGNIGIGERFAPAGSKNPNAVLVYSIPHGIEVKIVDDKNDQLSNYCVGNIVLKGDMIIDHYYTEMDKYGHLFRDGWYFTGDIGFLTDEGRLGVIGRNRDVLKVGGEFFAAATIENMVKNIYSSKVEDVLVAEYQDDNGIDRVGIYVVCPQWISESSFVAEFVEYCRKIRQYMITEIDLISCEIIPVSYVPETDTKKIKRFALKEVVDKKLQKKVKEHMMSKEKNTIGIEELLVDIIYEETQVKIDNYNSIFSEYGIVSRSVPAIIKEINKRFDMEISVASMFNFPTINMLSGHIIDKITNRKNNVIKIDRIEQDFNENIAIVGMSNRFPGGSNTPEDFFEFLMSGEDAIIDIPKERWDADKYYSENDDEPGKMYCKKGGFINAPFDEMDNNFFNISPREAASIDPHQRLLLELTWEAFENGGLDITEYNGTRTGVFLGLSNDEYGLSSINSGDLTKINTYSLTGICYSTACGRISYTYGFEGPCFSVDTACSSFLTALHLATVSLKNHDADAAVVGGASLMLTPVIGVAFSKLKAICHDGHCKTFDDRADGYGRGEGAGVIILKRLSDAERDKDHILGVIRATGINQDGKSNGLTAPNGESQRNIIEETLKRSGLKKSEIDYIETHGTGTSLGDPIEVNAIKEGYCDNANRQKPLYIGSVKSNIGHLEAASGVASVIKVLLSMQHEIIPANRGFVIPSTKIKWTDDIKVVSENMPWRGDDHIRRASINSFGFGGSNAHVIIEEYVKDKKDSDYKEPLNSFVLKISAKSKDALRELASKYLVLIRDTDEESLHSIISTANKGRGNYPYRIAITGENKKDMISALNGFLMGRKSTLGLNVYDENDIKKRDSKIAFMFTGQSSQYVKMAHTLFENNEVFKTAFLECDSLFMPFIMRSLVDLVYAEDASAEMIEKTVYAQPLIFTVEYALTKFWESVGVKPSLVIGHSIGEYAAAVVAGIMDLESAVKLVSLRGRLMNEAPGKGSMTTLFTDRVTTERLIGELSDTVNIAVHNSEGLCVISGVEEDVERVVKRAEAEEIKTRRLNVSHGFHSALMRPAAEQFIKIAGSVKFNPSNIIFMSSMYQRALREDEVLDTEYWANHICNEVKFYETISSIPQCEEYFFLEIGATNTLTSLCKYIFNGTCKCSNSLDVKSNDTVALNNAIAKLYVNHANINWKNYIIGKDEDWERVSSLPNYPFKRSRYWNEMQFDRVQGDLIMDGQFHSLLGQRIESPIMEDTIIFQRIYTPDTPFFMSEHIIFGTAIAPAAAYMALIISAMKEICNPSSISIQEIELRAPLAVRGRSKVQICITGAETGVATYRIMSCPLEPERNEWTVHTQGKVVINPGHLNPSRSADIENWKRLEFDVNEGAEHAVYPAMTDASFNLGKGFRRLMKSWRNDEEGVFYIEPDEKLPLTENYVIYPGVIDSVFHTMLCMVLESALLTLGRKETETMIPYFIGEFSYDYRNFDNLWVNTLAHIENQSIIGDSYVFNKDSEPVITISNMITKLTNHEDLLGATGIDREKEYYHYTWSKVDNVIDEHSNYKSICIICNSDTDLADFEKYSTLPVKRVSVNDMDEIDRIVGNMETPVLLLYCVEEKADDYYRPMKKLFELIKMENGFDSEKKHYLRIVTKKAIPFKNSEINLSQSLLWGFAKSFIAECPNNFKGIIDLEGKEKISEIFDVLLYGGYAELCVRDKALYASVLQRHSEYMRSIDNKTEKIDLLDDATYVIAGGTGSVGQAYIGALVESGAKHIAVISRHEPKESFINSMNELGVDVQCFTGDITVKEDVGNVISKIQETMPAIKGVINVSGVFRDMVFNDMKWEDFRFVLEPKVYGSMNLFEKTKNLEIDFFHMTSSITSILGNIGQTNYAAANYFMNCFAEYVTSQGIRSNVICWGPWGGSDVVTTEAVERNMQNIGLKPYTVKAGQQILQDSLERYSGSFMAVSVDWNKFSSGMVNPYTGQLLKRLVNREEKKQENNNIYDFITLINGMTKKEVRRLLRNRITQICREVMGYEEDDVLDENTAFKELGADSLMIFSMRNAINTLIKGDVGVSDFYNYATIEKLTNHIMEDILVIEQEEEIKKDSLDDLANELSSLLD